MTNNADARLAREWAENVNPMMPNEYVCAARDYILATTTPPTMADVEWDAEVHAGLCAEHEDYGTVRMLDHDHHDGTILCLTILLRHEWSAECDLTPIPGTRLDLTPRREPETESTPGHPAQLIIEADYRNAPAGTVVATEGEGAWTWTKDRHGYWEAFGVGGGFSDSAVSGEARRVLRWGETL